MKSACLTPPPPRHASWTRRCALAASSSLSNRLDVFCFFSRLCGSFLPAAVYFLLSVASPFSHFACLCLSVRLSSMSSPVGLSLCCLNAAALLKKKQPYYNSHRALRQVQVTPSGATWVSVFPWHVWNVSDECVIWSAGSSRVFDMFQFRNSNKNRKQWVFFNWSRVRQTREVSWI